MKEKPITQSLLPLVMAGLLSASTTLFLYLYRHQVSNIIAGKHDIELALAGDPNNTTVPDQLNLFQKEAGNKIHIVNVFTNLNDGNLESLKTQSLSNIAHIDSDPMITFELFTGSDDKDVLSRYNNGEFDKYTDKLVSILAEFLAKPENQNREVYLRFLHEPNGNWYPWSQDPSGFEKAFERFSNKIRRQFPSSDRVKIILNMNHKSWGKHGLSDFLTPKNLANADMVGVDGYIDAPSQTPESVFSEFFEYLESNNISKPVSISEFGVNRKLGAELQSQKIQNLISKNVDDQDFDRSDDSN